MFDPLPPDEFCRKWIPRIYQLQPKDRGYKQACCKMLSVLTGYTESTIRHWLQKNPYPIPIPVQKQLRTIDYLWQIKLITADIPSPNDFNNF